MSVFSSFSFSAAFSVWCSCSFFYTNDMRCPVCRRDLSENAFIQNFAPCMQDALLARTAAMHLGAAQDDDVSELTVDLSVAALAHDLVFEVDMQ